MFRPALPLALLLAVACAPASPGTRTPAPASRDEIRITVRNHRWDRVTVYAMDGATRRRLGEVEAVSTVVWRVPDPASGRIGFVVDVFASRERFGIRPEPVRVGNRMELVLHNHAPNSYLSVFQ